MVFQSYALYPHMTVAENISYPLKLRRTPKDERDRLIREAAAKVHLTDFLDRQPRNLSGGQRQRVALARAMVRRPALFLMDEPLSNLDAKLRGQMRAELKRLQHDLGVTTIYVTHDQIEAMTLAHRVAIMHHGVIQQIGSPREIYDDPANLFVAGFIGSPPMNTLRGRVRGGRFSGHDVDLDMQGFADLADTVLGVRPEDCRVVDSGTGAVAASIFSVEMTGNETIVTCAVEDAQFVVKMGKEFDAPIDAPVGIAIDPSKACLFDAADQQRLRPNPGRAA
jgi:multiple sugar transport system ATP-binding protein